MNTTKIFRVFLLVGLSFSFPLCAETASRARLKSADNARDALVKALKAKLDAGSYRMKLVQVSNVGMSSTQEADYVAPDKYRVVAEMSTGNGNSGRQEMIVVGQQAYSKTPEGKWQKTEIDPKKLEFIRLRDQTLIENLSKAQAVEVKFSGGVRDGLQAFVYEQTVASTPKIVTRGKTTIWVSAADGFPRKMELVADTNFHGTLMNLKSTTTYYDYNADIRIEAPL
jgi:outer membrane lipoprotein-sorting protein